MDVYGEWLALSMRPRLVLALPFPQRCYGVEAMVMLRQSLHETNLDFIRLLVSHIFRELSGHNAISQSEARSEEALSAPP
jgi:hypothetical protein